MKENRFVPNSGGIMIELVVGIIFFIVISLFTVNIFLKTEEYKNEADELSESMLRAESVAERIRSYDECEKTWKDVFLEQTEDRTNEYIIDRYDKDWNSTKTEDRYMLTVTVEENEKGQGILAKYIIKIYKKDKKTGKKEIYSLNTVRFWDGGRK